MKEYKDMLVENRPFQELECGCVLYPHFTAGQWVPSDNGPVYMTGTHYEGYIDTYLCHEGHDR